MLSDNLHLPEFLHMVFTVNKKHGPVFLLLVCAFELKTVQKTWLFLVMS